MNFTLDRIPPCYYGIRIHVDCFPRIFRFCAREKKWWLLPLMVLLLILAVILIFASSSGIVWALYPF